MLDNPLLRIPVLAGAAVVDELIYVFLHRFFDQSLPAPFVETTAYKVIWTTVAGTILCYVLDRFFSDTAKQRRQFAFRRRIARRGASSRRF